MQVINAKSGLVDLKVDSIFYSPNFSFEVRGELTPVCLLLASLRISIIKVANSRALNLASFCLPCKK